MPPLTRAEASGIGARAADVAWRDMRTFYLVAIAMMLGCAEPDPGPQPVQCDVGRSNAGECIALCSATCGRDFDCCYVEDGEWQIYEADCGPCP